MGDHYDRDAEALVKRLKKADLARYIAGVRREAHEREENLHKANREAHKREEKAREMWKSCNDYAKSIEQELANLRHISRAIRSVLLHRGHMVNDKQLSIILNETESGYSPRERQKRVDSLVNEKKIPHSLRDAVGVIMDLLDACADVAPFEGGPTYDDLRDLLDLALDDRAELMQKLGLTDREWSAQGGACEADFEF